MRIRGYVRLSDLRFAADLTPEEREEAETGLDRQAEDIRQYSRTGGHTVERIVEEAGSAFHGLEPIHVDQRKEKSVGPPPVDQSGCQIIVERSTVAEAGEGIDECLGPSQ